MAPRLIGELTTDDGKRFKVDATLTPIGEPTPPTPPTPPEPTPPPSGNLPGQVLDLRNWKLTRPDAKEIVQPALAAYRDEFFRVVDREVRFKAPAIGGTTTNTSYTRCELREMVGSQRAAWSTRDGRHYMRGISRILSLPGGKPEVCFAQIHATSDDLVRLICEGTTLVWDAMDGAKHGVLLENYKLGDPIDWAFDVAGGRVDILLNGEVKGTFTSDETACYFKAGCYTLSNAKTGAKAGDYGEVAIRLLSMGPSVGPGPAPVPEPVPEPTPVPTPTPTPGDGFQLVTGNPFEAIRNAAPGAKLDFGWKRYEQTDSLVIDKDLTLRRLHLYGPTLLPSEPSVWVHPGATITLLEPIIIGSADTGGKWSREFGNKQHGIMTGQAKGLTVRGGLIAHCGGDFVCITDKPGKGPSENVVFEDTIFTYSRRQGIAPSGVRGMVMRRCILTMAQRTVFDFESEGGGAHNFAVEDSHVDVASRQPNYVLGIGGADRPGAVNEGPFTFRRNKLYGGRFTVSNRSQAQVVLDDNRDSLPMGEFLDIKRLVAERFPGVPDLGRFLVGGEAARPAA